MKTRLMLGILTLCALLTINVVNLVSAEENWTRKADMPTQRSGFTTCIVNGKIFAIGGYVDGLGELSLSTVEVYDTKTDTWERKADMPTARTDAATSVVNGKIYAIGGTVLNRFEFDVLVNGQIRRIPKWKAADIPTVEMYDPDTDTWTQKADMPTPRNTSTCVVDGKIYAIGGTSTKIKSFRLDTVEVYDPTTDTWAKAKNMNRARAGAAVSVVDGEIYVMGGTGLPLIINHPGPFLSSMEAYNPQKNRWREIGDMPTAKSSHTASVINGKIYVMGGSFRNQGQDTKNFKTIEIHHPRTGRWTQKPDMPVAKAGHKAEVINGNIYIIDGPAHNNTPFATVEVYDTGEFHQSVNPIDKRLETWGMIKKVDRLPR
jgi:N-acetylneuraminic acid mutarotase